MAYSYSVNNTPATGAVAMYTLIATLITAGWSQVDSSDGTTQAAGQVTTGASGTGGLGNNSAWVRLQAPAVNGGAITNQQREFTIQRGTTDRDWRIKYSASAGFTGGAATQTPNNTTDCVILLGAGTDASPTYGTSWLPVNAGYRYHVIAGGADEFYSFMAFSVTNAITTLTSCIFLDVMAPGSYPSVDVDPAVTYVNSSTPLSENTTTSTAAQSTSATPSITRAWLGPVSNAQTSTTTNSVKVGAVTWGSSLIGNASTLGTNPFTLKDDTVPVPWLRTASSTQPVGWKGFSTLFLWPTVARTNLDTYNISGTRDRIYLNGYCCPWSGAVPAT